MVKSFLLKLTCVNFNSTYSSRPITVFTEIQSSDQQPIMSGSSTQSLDDGRKAPFTESTCDEVLENIDTRSSIGISSELRRARLEVSLERSRKRTVNLMNFSLRIDFDHK